MNKLIQKKMGHAINEEPDVCLCAFFLFSFGFVIQMICTIVRCTRYIRTKKKERKITDDGQRIYEVKRNINHKTKFEKKEKKNQLTETYSILSNEGLA